MSSMNFAEAVEYVMDSFDAPDVFAPILLQGDMGIGKSAVAFVASNLLAAKTGKKVRVVDLRLAHCDAGDIKGMPERGNGYVFYEKGNWFPMHAEDREQLKAVLASLGRPMAVLPGQEEELVILFLDEINRAPRDVQQAVFQLVYDRRLDDVRVSDNCVIMSAMNDNSDLYQTTRMDPALIDRFFVVKFKPSDAEWLNFFEGEIREQRAHDAVVRFLRSNSTYIDPSSEAIEASTDTNQKTFSRRSWFRLARMLKKREVLKEMDITEWDSGYLMRYASSMVGVEAGTKFTRYVESSYQSLSPKEVLFKYSDTLSKRVLQARPDELAALVDEISRIFLDLPMEERTDKVQSNVFRLMVDFPDEIAKKFADCLNAGGKSRFLATMLKREDLGSYRRVLGKNSEGKNEVKVYATAMQRFTDVHMQGSSTAKKHA